MRTICFLLFLFLQLQFAYVNRLQYGTLRRLPFTECLPKQHITILSYQLWVWMVRIEFILSEDLLRTPAEVMRRVEIHLGLRPFDYAMETLVKYNTASCLGWARSASHTAPHPIVTKTSDNSPASHIIGSRGTTEAVLVTKGIRPEDTPCLRDDSTNSYYDVPIRVTKFFEPHIATLQQLLPALNFSNWMR